MTRRRRDALVCVGCRACDTRLAVGPACQLEGVLELARRNVRFRPCCALADVVVVCAPGDPCRHVEDRRGFED